MIQRKHLFVNFLALYGLCVIGMYPLTVDMKSMKIGKQRIKWRRAIFYFWYILGILHGAFIFLRLLQIIVIPGHFVMEHVPLHIFAAVLTVYTVMVSKVLLLEHSDACVEIFNQLFEVSPQDDDDTKFEAKGLGSYTLQEQWVLGSPWNFFAFCESVFVIFQIYYDDALHFFYSLVRADDGQTPFWVTGIFLVVESALYLYYISSAYLAAMIAVLYYETTMEKLEKSVRYIKSLAFSMPAAFTKTADRITRLILMECKVGRKAQLETNLFNIAFALTTFYYKQLCIIFSITSYFFCIRLMSTQPLMGLVWLNVAIFNTCLYSIMYDRAFKVPEKMGDWKKALHVVGQNLRNKQSRDEVRKIIRSIPNVGIKVGEFNTFERESTPKYISFIMNTVVSLLVSFKK